MEKGGEVKEKTSIERNKRRWRRGKERQMNA